MEVPPIRKFFASFLEKETKKYSGGLLKIKLRNQNSAFQAL